MGLFYKASPKEFLQIRNKVFLDFGLPPLQRQGFQKSPFSSAWFGRNNIGDYTYDLCRLVPSSILEIIVVHISTGDRWIKVFLNVFSLEPSLGSIEQLKEIDGLKFRLPPNNLSEMQLRVDDITGPPILNYSFWFENHKLKSYYTKSGLKKRAEELGKIIESDLSNIDHFVKRWHEIHKPMLTTWDGNPIK